MQLLRRMWLQKLRGQGSGWDFPPRTQDQASCPGTRGSQVCTTWHQGTVLPPHVLDRLEVEASEGHMMYWWQAAGNGTTPHSRWFTGTADVHVGGRPVSPGSGRSHNCGGVGEMSSRQRWPPCQCLSWTSKSPLASLGAWSPPWKAWSQQSGTIQFALCWDQAVWDLFDLKRAST